jgi:hypothetical protein
VPPPDPADARAREAVAQREFLRALVTDAAVPRGFDAEHVAHQAAALTRKRGRLVAYDRPDLALPLGADFEAVFARYARANPLHTDDRTGDAHRFARWLEACRMHGTPTYSAHGP